MNLADGRLRAQFGAVGVFARLLQGRRAEGEVPGGGTVGRLAPPRAPTHQTVFALPGLGTASPNEPLAPTVRTGYCLERSGDGNMGPGNG